MSRKWILCLLLLIISPFLYAQSDLIDGTIITLEGETLSVKIKPSKPDKLAKGINVFNDTTQEFTKLTAKNISYLNMLMLNIFQNQLRVSQYLWKE